MRKNLECPVSSEYEICERVNGYLRYRPVAEKNETVTQTKVKSVPKSQNKNNSKKKVVLSIITYDPRTESALTYSQVYQALEKTPSSFDWTSLWEVIEGLIWD